jgi:hypothetical protein
MMIRKPRGTYFDELRNHQLLIQACNIFPCFLNGQCRLNAQLHLINYNDSLYDPDRNCEPVDVVGVYYVTFHLQQGTVHKPHAPHSSFVLPITCNPVAKIKIPYSFALVRMSRGFQILRTFTAVLGVRIVLF